MADSVKSNEKPWWMTYRERQYRPQHKEPVELVLRRSMKECWTEYLQRVTISGVSLINNPTAAWWQKLFWCIIFAVAVTTLGFCLMSIWSSLSQPLIVSMESTTYSIADIDFPAVVLCNINRISKKKLHVIALQEYENGIQSKEFKKQFKNLETFEGMLAEAGRLINFEYSEDKLVFVEPVEFDTTSVIDAMAALAPNCSEMLLSCFWGGVKSNCDDLFETRRTALGHCCAFNYVLNLNGISQRETSKEIKRQKIPGRRHGLTVTIDPQKDDYLYPLRPIYGFHVLLFDAKTYPDMSGGRIIHRMCEASVVNYIELSSRKQYATNEVRKYSPFTRNCYFHDEVPEYGNMYSMSACISKCRVNTVQSLCRCTPYFIPITKDEGPICTISELKCLNKYKEKLFFLYPTTKNKEGLEQELQNSLYCPECLPDCEHTQHTTKINKIDVGKMDAGGLKKILRIHQSNTVNVTNKCLLRIYQATTDGVLDKLDVVLYWFEFFSNFGGFAGLLLGLSITTVFEIIYFFFIYLFKITFKNIQARK